MELLMEWITQIILFIILATIIDLIVPQSSFQKYIKLVISLILILILLNPVFYLLDIDISGAVESSIQLLDQENKEDSIENLIDLQKIEIESTQDAYILEQMAVQLIDLAKEPLNAKMSAEITDIQFQFNSSSVSYDNLEEVIVYLREYKEEEGAIEAVEDVVINTEDSVEKETITDGEIIELLRDTWELKDKEITIFWEGGAS